MPSFNRNNSYPKKTDNRNVSTKPKNPTGFDAPPKELPSQYVDEAESIMKELNDENIRLTTSKIRNLLSMITEVYQDEMTSNSDTLSEDSQHRLQMIRVRIAYEVGRDVVKGVPGPVYRFVKRSELLSYIKGIGDSRAKFIAFARYMEALVAYHRFFGGADH